MPNINYKKVLKKIQILLIVAALINKPFWEFPHDTSK